MSVCVGWRLFLLVWCKQKSTSYKEETQLKDQFKQITTACHILAYTILYLVKPKDIQQDEMGSGVNLD